MLSVTRHQVPEGQGDQFAADMYAALDLLRVRPGFVSATLGRSTDEGDLWVLVTVWRDVGSFRRALSSYEVKVGVVPLLSTTIDDATAFEPLLTADAESMARHSSDRSPHADTGGPADG